MSWQGLMVPVAVGAAVAALTPAALRALPAPSDEPASRPYVRLATARFAGVAFVLIATGGLLVTAIAPPYWAAWLGLGTAGILGAMVDARTGYLPSVLMRVGWVLTVAGVSVTAGMVGDGQVLLRAVLGGGFTTALFWLFHRIGGGFGFGDVRLAPIVGAAAAAPGWPTLATALLMGGLIGVAWGLVWQASGRGKAFPYGPALVAGPYLALAAGVFLSS